MRWVLNLWRAWFGETVAGVEAAADKHRAEHGRRADWKTVWVLIVAAVALTGQNFWQNVVIAEPDTQPGWVKISKLSEWTHLPPRLLSVLAFALGCVVWYTVPAVLVVKLVFRERVRDYGVKLAGWSSGWKIYLVFVAVMVPLVVVFSSEQRFLDLYPFYKWQAADGWERLLIWEAAYALQFMGLEFFFRGFLVHGLKHRFGVYSVFVMTVPYCMIHFGKALPECLASIIAGIALGLMSLKTRSVWLGAALHISVAWGMDTCSLWRKGAFTVGVE